MASGWDGQLDNAVNMNALKRAEVTLTDSKYLYHYTNKAAANNISKVGMQTKYSSDGFLYLTNKGNLKPLQAQIELALPANRSVPSSLLRINTKELNPFLIRRVQGNLPGLGANYCSTDPPNMIECDPSHSFKKESIFLLMPIMLIGQYTRCFFGKLMVSITWERLSFGWGILLNHGGSL